MTLLIGIVEFEPFIEAFAGIVKFGAINVGQTLGIDHNLHSERIPYLVIYFDSVGEIKLVGPAGEIEITKGVIAAKRHIHATTADAEKMGLTNGQIVSVTIPTSNERNLTFGDVVVRVSDSYALAMHIDTDEANAAGMAPNTIGTIIK